MSGPVDETSLDYAHTLDHKDQLRHLRREFVFPTKGDLKRTSLEKPAVTPKQDKCEQYPSDDDTPSIYLCGNSLGLQPASVRKYVVAQLDTWASKGVYGHFKPLTETPLVPWLDMDDAVQGPMAAIVGAEHSEVAVMQTLSANLHLLMASFFRPTTQRHKIILEGKAFPSDHYVVESQLRHHNLDPATSMVLLTPPSSSAPLLTTNDILSTIDAHADSTALLLLPGIQFYTGQLFDIATITAHAQSRGIVVGWDLAHAAGNVPLNLHDWNVDFAAWCTYKYLNCGPGAIGALFVHKRHTRISRHLTSPVASKAVPNGHDDTPTERTMPTPTYLPRLSGWWGSDKSSRFAMTNAFVPSPGAAGWQLSNPSALDMAAVMASLSVFGMTSMEALRAKSVALTGYLERLLLVRRAEIVDDLHLERERDPLYEIITPREREQRGAQLSIRLSPALLEPVMASLQEAGVVVDERRPDVIRVAPAPLYNTFEDVWRFVDAFARAIGDALGNGQGVNGEEGGKGVDVNEHGIEKGKAVMGDAGLNGGSFVEAGLGAAKGGMGGSKRVFREIG